MGNRMICWPYIPVTISSVFLPLKVSPTREVAPINSRMSSLSEPLTRFEDQRDKTNSKRFFIILYSECYHQVVLLLCFLFYLFSLCPNHV